MGARIAKPEFYVFLDILYNIQQEIFLMNWASTLERTFVIAWRVTFHSFILWRDKSSVLVIIL